MTPGDTPKTPLPHNPVKPRHISIESHFLSNFVNNCTIYCLLLAALNLIPHSSRAERQYGRKD